MDSKTPDLKNALKNVGLDELYWLAKFEIGQTDINRFQVGDTNNFEKLKKSVRYDWEENALQEVLEIGFDSFANLQQNRKDGMVKRLRHAKEIICSLQKSKECGFSDTNPAVIKNEKLLMYILSIPLKQWQEIRQNMSLEEFVYGLEVDVDVLCGAEIRHKDMSVPEILKNASQGQALKGILLTKESAEMSLGQKPVLAVTNDLKLLKPEQAQQDYCLDSLSQDKTLGHQLITDVMGYSTLEGRREVDSSHNMSETDLVLKPSDKFYTRELHSVLTTAVCKIDHRMLKLSPHAIWDLRELEKLISNGQDQDIADFSCTFLKTFGSHIKCGFVHLGGVYKWTVSYFNEAGCSEKGDIQNIVCDAHSKFVSMSFSRRGPNVSVSQQADSSTAQVLRNWGFQHDAEIFKHLDVHVDRKGGPVDVNTFPIWKMGLTGQQSAWAVVDRKSDKSNNLIGIWDVILNHQGDLKNCSEIASKIYSCWQQLNGTSLAFAEYRAENMDRFQKTEQEANPSTFYLRDISVRNIPSLLSAAKDLNAHLPPTSSADSRNRRLTSRLSELVDNLWIHLQKDGKVYEKFFLSAILCYLRYDCKERKFIQPVTPERLDNFLSESEKKWKEYEAYSQTGATRLQAYLFILLISAIPSDLELQEKHNQYLHVAGVLQKHVTKDINFVLGKFSHTTSDHRCPLAGELTKLLQSKTPMTDVKKMTIVTTIQKTSQHSNAVSNVKQEKKKVPTATRFPIAERMLEDLGLQCYYPSKISVQDVMNIGKSMPNHSQSNLAWVILERLMMLDYNGRDGELKNDEAGQVDRQPGIDRLNVKDSILAGFSHLHSKVEDKSKNPLDVFITIFACCDLELRQRLIQKMFMCHLAIPLLYPVLRNDTLMFSMWPLRGIVAEWRNTEDQACEKSLVELQVNTISFVRLGKPSYSKSKLINLILNDKHSTFFNVDCPQGNTRHSIATGLVEASWYLPNGKESDMYSDVTMFLNLRGDAVKLETQSHLLSKISHVIVACIEYNDLDPDNENVMQHLSRMHATCKHILLLLQANDPEKINYELLERILQNCESNFSNASIICDFIGPKKKNADQMKTDLRLALAESPTIGGKLSITDVCSVVTKLDLDIDENCSEDCTKGRQLAHNVLRHIGKEDAITCKKMLLLQGDCLLEWSRFCKQRHRPSLPSDRSSVYYAGEMQTAMDEQRQEQLKICRELCPMVEEFITVLRQTRETRGLVNFFLQWLKLHLNRMSMDALPIFNRQYHEAWAALKTAKTAATGNFQELRENLNKAETRLASASFGLEHLLREMGQVYEANVEGKRGERHRVDTRVKQLPKIGASLLLQGHPFEIMDGDSSSVPLTWLKAVLACVQELTKNKKLFVLSILGIQSSGKSTLLNTLFGLQFAVSAGRCTRGVYIQLVEVSESSKGIPYDYVLIVDTEGLRAPELDMCNYDNDNELATLAVGIGDVTIVNIKGENVSEVKDVLQIVVHAFLRMKLVSQGIEMKRSCIFIHQNVPALNAKEKMKTGCQKLLENLDEMTREAAAMENIPNINTFGQVIEFDWTKHVWYFSSIWEGDPPMAPANPGYSTKAKEVRNSLLYELAKKHTSFVTFPDFMLRLKDVWNAVLDKDFVFSFRNTLAAKAYYGLECKYFDLTWDMEKQIMNWQTGKAAIRLQLCCCEEDLDECYSQIERELEAQITLNLNRVTTELRDYFENNHLKDILIQWREQKLLSLKFAAEQVLQKVKLGMLEIRDVRKVDVLHQLKKESNEAVIMNKAKELAEELKSVQPDSTHMQSRFDKMWINLVASLVTREHRGEESIATCVKRSLYEKFPSHQSWVDDELNRNSITENMEENRHSLVGSFSVYEIKTGGCVNIGLGRPEPRGLLRKLSDYVPSWLKRHPTHHSSNALQRINVVLQKIQVYLESLSSGMSKFHPSFAHEVIQFVVLGFDEITQNEGYQLKLLPQFEVTLAVHACRHATPVFQKMQADYDQQYGAKAKLEAYKKTAFNLFKNVVEQCRKEIIVADLICDRLEGLITKNVKETLPREIAKDHIDNFGNNKYHLMLDILDHLALKADFQACKAYVRQPKSYAFQWLTLHINNQLFMSKENELPLYVQKADSYIRSIIDRIKYSSTTATCTMSSHQNKTLKIWVTTFRETMAQNLAVPESELKQVLTENVSDFEYLHGIIVKELPMLHKRILHFFERQTAENIQWEGTSPYQQVLDKLWGCEATCPFCGEPCQLRDPNHLVDNLSHRCIQHRPDGVYGTHDKNTGQLIVENCCYNVQKPGLKFSCRFGGYECRKTGNCTTTGTQNVYHDYTKYKTFIPSWDIPPSPSMESSEYWMWFLAKYAKELCQTYKTELPDIPESWKNITMEDARASLRQYQQDLTS